MNSIGHCVPDRIESNLLRFESNGEVSEDSRNTMFLSFLSEIFLLFFSYCSLRGKINFYPFKFSINT